MIPATFEELLRNSKSKAWGLMPGFGRNRLLKGPLETSAEVFYSLKPQVFHFEKNPDVKIQLERLMVAGRVEH